MAVRLYNECLEGITTTSPPCGCIFTKKMWHKKKQLFQAAVCTAHLFDTAKLKNLFHTYIILSIFLIIFKIEPTPILSLVSALMGFLGPQDIIEYE